MEGPLLKVSNIDCRFGGLLANDNVSFEVNRGEILGLIGPNGAGKSTLFNVIAGVKKPEKGQLLFEGTDIRNYTTTHRCIAGLARTFQVVRTFESMSVIDNVVVGALVRQSSTESARRKARDVLRFVGLDRLCYIPANELTPPDKRRLELARALATDPKLLLLDEVMTGLTPAEAQSGVDLIREIVQRGVTVVMVEHIMEVIMPLVHRLVVLDLGRVIVTGTPAEVANDPKVIAAYFGDRKRA